MRKALKRHVIPALKRMGFVGTSSKFQRKSDEWLDLLNVQYWKYGGEFILEFGRRERGPLQTSWGEVVPEEKLATEARPRRRRGVPRGAAVTERLASVLPNGATG